MRSYMKPIPAKENISRGEELNILSGVSGSKEDISFTVTVWGRINKSWKALTAKKIELACEEHKHLYFTLSPDVFSSSFWGDDIDEIELLVSEAKPSENDRGVIIFIV